MNALSILILKIYKYKYNHNTIYYLISSIIIINNKYSINIIR